MRHVGMIVGILVASSFALAANEPFAGMAELCNLDPNRPADFTVQLIDKSVPGGVFWPGDAVWFTFQFTNKTDKPIQAAGKVEVIHYGTRLADEDVFKPLAFKIADAGSVPIQVDIPAKGFANVTVRPALPETFGGYLLIVDLPGHGRQFAAACVRTPVSTPGKVQHPRLALDVPGYRFSLDSLAMFRRLGIKGARTEIGYHQTDRPDFHWRFAQSAKMMALMELNDVTLMITAAAGGPQPMGRERPHLSDDGTTLGGKSDMAWLPEADEDFQKWCRIYAGTFGWPKGPVNAMELWNEPWEGLSISGWGADMLRYRDLYARMALGVEEARKQDRVQVLIGGCCSSMNTDDKLFCDGTDTFLKWLDFTSIHYQPMCAMPALIPEWMNRKSPYGPVRVWDTESWVANSDDRVAVVVASMYAQGQSRTAGVLHDAVYSVEGYQLKTSGGTSKETSLRVYSVASAVAACQKFIGERAFKEILFKNGLPWVFVFEGLPVADAGGKKPAPDEDDGAMVVVGDLAGVYEHDRMLFRSVKGLSEDQRVSAVKKRIAALPPDAPAKARKELDFALKAARVLDGATMTLTDGGGAFVLYDFYGNPVPSKSASGQTPRGEGGKITVPLDGLGYFLRTDGSKGSFAKLVEAVRSSRIDGYEPLDVVAYDMTARIESQPTLRLKLTNILNRPVAGKLTVKLGELKLEGAEQDLSFDAHQTKELALKVVGGSPVPSNTYPMSLAFDAGKDGKSLQEEEMHVNVIAKRTIAVDGDLKDWKDVLPQPIRAAAGASVNLTEKAWFPFEKFEQGVSKGFAVGYVAYDADCFYFAAKIADDTPYEGGVRFATRDDDQYFYPEKATFVTRDRSGNVTKSEQLTWPQGVRRFSYRKWPDTPSGGKGDNVQIGFNAIPQDKKGWYTHPPGTMPRFMVYKTTDYEYALNQVAPKYGGGTEIWRLAAPGAPRKHFYPRQPKAPVDGGPVEKGKLAIVRQGSTCIVEAAIPWSEIPDVKNRLDAGEPIKFTFRVNDDGAGYELAGGRSVSKIDTYSLHDYWETSWANEIEFAFEK